ncbi:DUF2951 domain-containing protein [Staphylococcus arlettae]|uniref:DUF2951 domain-containing protein n=1 Tax=Staphylococcus arlettae TaxID=29378 RepID=UPI0021D06D18|nr:DUF2951 domain-containing protein [Staphylococcus arlettae]UXU51797.1 DUF2951 domain-containing protein [Staphylococcus arlettae]
MEGERQRDDHERRIKRLEQNDEKIFNSLEEVRKGQHTQELVNQKMDFTLESINREREIEKENKEESRKEFKQLRWLIIGTIFTLLSSLILAAIRSWLGI